MEQPNVFMGIGQRISISRRRKNKKAPDTVSPRRGSRWDQVFVFLPMRHAVVFACTWGNAFRTSGIEGSRPLTLRKRSTHRTRGVCSTRGMASLLFLRFNFLGLLTF